MTNEIWTTVVMDGIEYNYEVSNTGKIRNKKTGRTLKLKVDKYGYQVIGLTRSGKQKFFLVHRIVATAFIPNVDNLPQVNHIDENKLNNNVENLEWCTAKANCNHATRNERISKSKTGVSIKRQGLKLVATNIKTGEQFTFRTQNECAEELNLDQSEISRVLNGKREHTKGWTFVEIDEVQLSTSF